MALHNTGFVGTNIKQRAVCARPSSSGSTCKNIRPVAAFQPISPGVFSKPKQLPLRYRRGTFSIAAHENEANVTVQDESKEKASNQDTNSYFFKTEGNSSNGGASLNDLQEQAKAWWTKLREEERIGQRGEGWVAAQVALIIAIIFVPSQLEGVASILGLSTFFGGVVLALFGVRELGDMITPLPEPRDDGKLVTGGIYSLVRHPMYGGLLLGALGLSAWTSDAERYLLTAALFYVLTEKAAFEEAALAKKFPDYEEYKKKTKKFIPYIY